CYATTFKREASMGLFDKSKGGSAVAEPQTGGPLLETLKTRYQSVLTTMHEEGVRLQNLHVQDGKLFIRAEAPSVAVKNRVWDQIKLVNPAADDLIADITVNPSNPAPSTGAGARGAARTYTVKPGDTLSKIAQQFY